MVIRRLLRERLVQTAVPNQHIASSLDHVAEDVRPLRPVRERAMQHDEDEPAAERRKERGRSIHRARQHRREDESQHRVEGGLLRQKTPVAAADDDERGEEDDDAAQADLEERQRGRVPTQPEQRGGID